MADERQAPAQTKTPEWKVYFNGNFWGHHGRERAGREIPLNKQFDLDGSLWHIPALYACAKGYVVDFCVQVPTGRIHAFLDKWKLSVGSERMTISDEEQLRIDAENPLVVHKIPSLILNGTVLANDRGSCVTWNPCIPEFNRPEAERVLRHYGLDPAFGWAIWRYAFLWTKKRKPQLRTLAVTLTQGPVGIPGPHFRVSEPGVSIGLAHPVTGEPYTLTVHAYERQEMSREHFASQDQELPTHYTAMSYTLSPDLPDGAFAVSDCLRSDPPRLKRADPNAPPSASCVSVGIIGAAVGPAGNAQGKLRPACSALHFEPTQDVEWRTVFYEKRGEDATVALI